MTKQEMRHALLLANTIVWVATLLHPLYGLLAMFMLPLQFWLLWDLLNKKRTEDRRVADDVIYGTGAGGSGSAGILGSGKGGGGADYADCFSPCNTKTSAPPA